MFQLGKGRARSGKTTLDAVQVSMDDWKDALGSTVEWTCPASTGPVNTAAR